MNATDITTAPKNPEAPPRTILVVEDEPKLAQLLMDYLSAAHYGTHWLSGGMPVVAWVRRNKPDLILLDIMLPGRDGVSLCREIRSFSDVPIIMVTARVEEVDRVLGLDAGADDYICKPFSLREVVARVGAVFRRIDRLKQDRMPDHGFHIDDERLEIRFDGQLLDLTWSEFRLLGYMLSNPGRVFSRERLLECLHGDSRSLTDRTVDSHIKNIRRKLDQVAPGRELIVSVYGAGYKVEP
ncbi:response regulator [Methylotetracoccus oryzae]|uniref:response regulator n=1 Tax=Methylotetracoccus oryzae TaxID=1919059 RepID=UPI001F474C81|nr:response regulator [Methylotetracoccus oryzae]